MSHSFDMARRPRRRGFFVLASALAAFFAGCSSTETSGAPSPDAGTSGPDASEAKDSITIKGEGFTIPPGGDVTRCTAVKGTNATAKLTNRFRNKQAGHHVIVYVVAHSIEDGSFECPQGGQWNWSEIYASQKYDDAYELPEGVGFKLEPNQQFVVETHVINATANPIQSASEVTLDFVEESAVQFQAAALFVGSTNIAVEPHANGQAGATCTLPADLHVARFFGHTHRRGKELTVSKVTNGEAEAPFYTMGAWDDPKVIERLDFKAGDQLRVGCDYHNESDKKIGYPDEMCLAGSFYWPSNGTLACIAYGNDPTCNCFQPINGELGTGGKRVTLEVSRSASIANVKGDVAAGRPVYCYLYRKADIDKDGPIAAKLAYWTSSAQDAKPLANETDAIQMTMQDVTPGEYYATCAMDTIYGGYFPGVGAPIVYPYVPVIVGESASASPVALQLNIAKP